MLTYKASFRFVDGKFCGEVLDFPGVVAFGDDIDEARRMLASALVDMAETNLMHGEALPPPNAAATDPEADLEEPIYLLLTATSRVSVIAS